MSLPSLIFSTHDDIPKEITTVIGNGLDAANSAVAPLDQVRPVSVVVRHEDGEIIGGAIGRTWGLCCEIQQVWVHEAYRRQGIGCRIVSELHQLAEDRGCRTFYLETFSFQSPHFYKSLGYEVRLELKGFGEDITKYMMVRQLPLSIQSLSMARLTLRPYQSLDFDDFASLNADENVRRHVGGPLSRENAAPLFERFVSGSCLPGNEVWAVVLKNSGEYLGHCWFVQQGTDDPEMGLLVATRYWRQGYGTEIAKAMLEYAKNQTGNRQLMATVDCNHIASIRLLERVGMKRERIEQDDEGTHYVYSFNLAN
jgi:RimJ/RimL family protein N-acetyltransferase